METSITMELDAYLCEVFQSEDHDIRSYSSLSLAFIGDCVYDLMIKSLIIRKGNRPVNAMQKETSRLVQASAQICVTRQLYSAIRASRRKKHLPLNSYISLYDNEEISEEKESELIQIQNIASTNNPEDLVIHKESEDSFMNELEGNLSELERKVLYLHLLGTDYRTIAKLLGKSPKAVDNALQRIKTKAEELLTSI